MGCLVMGGLVMGGLVMGGLVMGCLKWWDVLYVNPLSDHGLKSNGKSWVLIPELKIHNIEYKNLCLIN